MPEGRYAMFSAADHGHMAHALRLAERGLYRTMPNPRVGCVIVKDNALVGEGWHERAGGPHAEARALLSAGAAARGATAYVTLEPCSYYGRTPPCADALIAAGVARVVAAMRDPNPLVSGRGIERLVQAGIPAEVGLMQAEALELNPGFVSRMTRGRPWLRLKTAASLDGRTALGNGESKWITGEAARADVQRWRARACAILTGVGTVLADDPRMNVRGIDTPRQPLRVIVDSSLRTPPTARILVTSLGGAGGNGSPLSAALPPPPFEKGGLGGIPEDSAHASAVESPSLPLFQRGMPLIVCAHPDPARQAALESAGAEVLALPDGNGRVDLPALLAELARRGVNELHTEAGATLNGALLAAGLVDEWLAYFAPLVLGHHARGLFDLPPLESMAGRKTFALHELSRIGEDLRLTLRPR